MLASCCRPRLHYIKHSRYGIVNPRMFKQRKVTFIIFHKENTKTLSFLKSMLSLHDLLQCVVFACAILQSITVRNRKTFYNESRIFKICVPGFQSVLFCLSLYIPYECSGCHFIFVHDAFAQIFPYTVMFGWIKYLSAVKHE